MLIEKSIDVEACVRLAEQSMRPYFEHYGLEWNSKARRELISTFDLFSGKNEMGTLVGYLVIREEGGSIFIVDIEIQEEYRCKGYGTAFIQFSKQRAFTKGYSELKLKVFKNNPAQQLYLRENFYVLSEEPNVLLMAFDCASSRQ